MKNVKFLKFTLVCGLFLLRIAGAAAQMTQVCGTPITENPTKNSTDTPKNLGTGGLVTSTISVSGFSGKIADVDLRTLLQHTTSNVSMTLQSPAGTIVTLTTGNGWGLANVFAGTLWDDSADPGIWGENLVTDCNYAPNSAKTPLAPEEPLGSFYGENPNGQWKLSVSGATGNGQLTRWELSISTMPALPKTVSDEFESADVVPIVGFLDEFSSEISVDGLFGQVAELQVETNLIYNIPNYVSMFLVAPSGRTLTLTSRNGGNNANVFNGTLWTDRQNAGYATDFAYAANVTASPLAPEEGLASLIGEDPNGLWVLKIKHLADGSFGVLNGWTLHLKTCDLGEPGVAATFRVKKVEQKNAPEFGLAEVQFEGTVLNNGTENVSVNSMLCPLFDQLGPALLSISEMPNAAGGNASQMPTFSQNFDGYVARNLLAANSGLLKPGEFFKFQFKAMLDPDALGAVEFPVSQFQVEVEGTQSGKTAEDFSDSGENPQTANANAPGDFGTSDDPTPVFAPILKASMRLISACGNDVSKTGGHTDAVFEIKLKNIGNTPLDQIFLENKMKAEMGTLFFAANAAENGFLPSGAVAQMPTLNAQFNGVDKTKILPGTNGKLLPGQTLALKVFAELNNLQAATLPAIFNRAEVRARAIDADENAILQPDAPVEWQVSDWTDDGSDPASFNVQNPGEDDKTPVPFIALLSNSKDLNLELGEAVPQSWFASGGQAVVYSNGCPIILVENNYNDGHEWLPGTCGATGKARVQFTFKTNCQNVCLKTEADIVFEDKTAPVFQPMPADLTVSCGDLQPIQNWLNGQTASDADTYVIGNDFVAPAPAGQKQAVVFTATDACGNKSTASANVTVVDNQAPAFVQSVLPSKTIACNETPVFDVPSANDVCSPVSLTFIDLSTQNGCSLVHIRTWTATEASGNSATISQTIFAVDNVAPTLNLPFQTYTLQCGETIPNAPPAVADNCSPGNHISLIFNDLQIAGQTFRVWTATDACGNSASASQIFTLAPDNLPPTFGMPLPTKTIACGSTPNFDNQTAADNCALANLTFADQTLPNGCTRQHVRTWMATDASGNSATISQTVLETDHDGPTLDLPFQTMTLNCGETIPNAPPTVSDDCSSDAQISLIFNDLQIAGQTFRVWTATDFCGNSATASQIFIAAPDTLAPVFLGVLNSKTIDCGETPIFDTPEISDNCSSPSLNFMDETVQNGCETRYVRTWTASDLAGNVAVAQQIIVSVDNEVPVFTSPASDLVLTAVEWQIFQQNQGWQAVLPLATDNCGAATVSLAGFQAVGDSCHFILRWLAADACGNEAFLESNLTVSDCGSSAASEVLENGVLRLFPNPANERLNIQFDFANDSKPMRYRVFDAAGRLVFENENLASDRETLDVSGFVPGTYFIVAETSFGVFRGSFLKVSR